MMSTATQKFRGGSTRRTTWNNCTSPTNRAAVALKRGADAYEAELAAERNEAEIEAEVERRLDRQLKERRARARHKPPT